MNFDAASKYLTNELTASPKAVFTEGRGLARAKVFLDNLGNPQEDYPVIHVAGTSGKGTVCYMLEAMLRAHGKTTGLHVSPHVHDIRERAIINGDLAGKQEYADTIAKLQPIIKVLSQTDYGQPTYFEATVAAAFELFKAHHIDYGVVETGLGGLYDFTNSIKRSDKLAVITTLGFDHVEILGHTLAEIATQKAGILPFDGHAIVLKPSDKSALQAITKTARERHTILHFVEDSSYRVIQDNPNGVIFNYHRDGLAINDIVINLHGAHQAQNATIAIRSLQYIAERDNWQLEPALIKQALANLHIPGRLERHHLFDHEVIFDGAHNPQKFAALIASLTAMDILPTTWVIALKQTKDCLEIMKTIAPYVDQLVITSFFSDQEGAATQLPMPMQTIEQAAQTAGIKNIVTEKDNSAALQQACQETSKGKSVVVSGSFYLLGDIMQHLKP